MLADAGPVADPRPLRVAIFGAMPGTGNLGVTALHLCLLDGIAQRAPTPVVTVFDDTPGCTSITTQLATGTLTYLRCGAIPTRRIYHPDSLWRIRASGRLGGLGSTAVRRLRSADAILDITAGDGFTDLYGERRFARAIQEKRLAVEQGRPLILVPQTIGPFRTEGARRAAAGVLRDAAMVWTRDRASQELVTELLGDAFDPSRHRRGVDLAYHLDAIAPADLPAPIAAWLDDDAPRPVVGINVSGLLLNDADGAARRFGLRADYRDVLRGFVRRVLDETDANVLLVPHVTTRPGHGEHDPDACDAIAGAVAPREPARLAILPPTTDPREAKWAIGRTDWFCGARMHATIAALSSRVPTAALAYSPKALGTFTECGLADGVADLAALDTNDVIEHLWTSWCRRDETQRRLDLTIPKILARAENQMDEIVAFCLACRRSRVTETRAAA
ncbi:MAG: polysaccharide pyruvyl transferase family protein [Planctomycetota bacterium]